VARIDKSRYFAQTRPVIDKYSKCGAPSHVSKYLLRFVLLVSYTFISVTYSNKKKFPLTGIEILANFRSRK
jgi:hypothetical protein